MFFRENHCECHPLLDEDSFMEMYSFARGLLRWMLAHPISITTSDRPNPFLFCRLTVKKYL